MDDEVGDEDVIVAHNKEEEKEDGLLKAEKEVGEKDVPKADVLKGDG